jgi:hypothetical protein
MSRFWKESAGPTLLDVARFWDRAPRHLRLEPRERPPPFAPAGCEEPRRLGAADAAAVSAFWSAEYGGPDWRLSLSASEVREVLGEPGCMALGVERDGALIGTIVGRSVIPAGATLLVGATGSVKEAFVIEGLCVHSAWRGQHLAGWLIAWIDHLMGLAGPRLFLWARDTPMSIPGGTAISCAMYGFLRSADRPQSTCVPHKLSIESLIRRWEAKVKPEETSILPTSFSPHRLVAYGIASGTCGGSSGGSNGTSNSTIVLLADTGRITVPGGERIYDLVWCEGGKVRELLESLFASILDGVVFVTSEGHQGGVTTAWPSPWRVGTSGGHAWYIYNYMPPCFWNAKVIIPRCDL